MLNLKFMDAMALKVRKKYVDHIFKKGKDVHDSPFEQYSDAYGDRKRANKFKRQAGGYANRITPVLTGDLMGDALPFATTTTFGIRFASHGGKVIGLAKMGRDLSTPNQPFPKNVLTMIDKDVAREISKQFKNKTTKVVLGK